MTVKWRMKRLSSLDSRQRRLHGLEGAPNGSRKLERLVGSRALGPTVPWCVVAPAHATNQRHSGRAKQCQSAISKSTLLASYAKWAACERTCLLDMQRGGKVMRKLTGALSISHASSCLFLPVVWGGRAGPTVDPPCLDVYTSIQLSIGLLGVVHRRRVSMGGKGAHRVD